MARFNGSTLDDTYDGTAADDIIRGKKGNDHLSGGDGNDLIKGGGGRDVLVGGAGDDTLKGGGGNDRLIADDGTDTLTGGRGADTFEVGYDSDYVIITDFENGVDKIDLSAFGMDPQDQSASDVWGYLGTEDGNTYLQFYRDTGNNTSDQFLTIELQDFDYTNIDLSDYIL